MSQIQLQQQYPHITDVSTDPKSNQTYIKAFLMDDSVNRNFWHVPTNVMKKYASSFIGRPWIIHPNGDHPNYLKEGVASDSKTFIEDVLNVQDRYKAGEIIDITYEPLKENPEHKAFFATIKVTNPDVMDRLKSGAISSYVSPQIYDLSKANPGESTTEFIPLHIATVNEPAYGNIARIKGMCNGSGPTCINALKSAAVQLVNMIDQGIAVGKDNSSFLKNSAIVNNTLTNIPNYNTNPVIAANGYNPYDPQNQQQQYVDQNGQLISQRMQTQEVDANGNLIIRTEDKKPQAGAGRKQQQQQPQIIANPEQTQAQAPITQAPVATNVPQNPDIAINTAQQPQVPNELLDTIKGLQASLTGMSDRLSQIENFKKSAEDEKIKKASEAQRQIIESVFTPEVIADEQAREDVINYFVSLPLSDEDLQKILDMIVTGTFNSATTGAAADTQQASKPNKVGRPKGSVKQASVLNLNRLVMQNNVQDSYAPNPGSIARRIFGDIDVDNIA